ncbi:MAG: ArsA-related P-loop ATPase [Holophagaceae bacterium]
MPTTVQPLLERLAARKLVVVTGKGGVGKTTVTALLGLMLSRIGRRVLLLETDPRESLHQVLGVEPSGGAVVAAGPRLWIQNLQAQAVMAELVRAKVPLGILATRILEHPLYQHFVEGAPGLKETALLGHAWGLAVHGGAPPVDLVLLDAPASGHGVGLLAAPGLLAESIRDGQLGAVIGDIAAFLAEPANCAMVAATLAEEMPVQETLELVAQMEVRFGRGPEAVVVNALYPPCPASAKGPGEALALWRQRRTVNEAELRRLKAAWKGPRVELPLLPLDRSRDLLEDLAPNCVEVAR